MTQPEKCFYATAGKHECNGGAWSLGLKELTPTLKTGEFYFKLGKFASAAACRRTIDKVSHLNILETYATLYAPLEKAPFTPQVVIIIANPRGMLKLAQGSLFLTGGRIYSEFSGIQSLCSDATAQTYLSGRPNFSLGCDGSRKFSGIEDGEMVMGLPAELPPGLTAALKVVAAAPGSKYPGDRRCRCCRLPAFDFTIHPPYAAMPTGRGVALRGLATRFVTLTGKFLCRCW